MNLLQPSSPRRDQSRSNTLEEPQVAAFTFFSHEGDDLSFLVTQVHPSDMDTIYFKAVTLLADIEMKAVSYTHLTLPTILRV